MKNKNIFKLITASILVALISLAGCQKMEIVKVVGFIQGHAFDGNTNAPLDSVKVVWSVAGAKDSITATADDGYLIKDLPQGNYSIWCSKANYTTVVADIYIDDLNLSSTTVRGGENKEQIVTYNPNLYPLNASINGRVYKSENGVNIPIAGAVVQLNYDQLNNQDDDNYRFVPNIYEATTDVDGYYTFTNIPATDVYIRFLDYTDANNETYYDNNSHNTYSRRIYLNSGQSYTFGNIYLTQQTDNISLIASNLWTSSGETVESFPVADDITLTFNKNVNETNTTNLGYVYLENNNTGALIASTITYTDNVITINPDEDLSEDTWYRVRYDVYSAREYDNTSSTITFKTVSNEVVPAQVSNFAIDYNSMGTGWVADYNTTGIYFMLDILSNADTYEVFAKDSYSNSEYVKIATINQADYQQGTLTFWTTLPGQFDYYEDDGIQTPFSHGTTVSYKVRAVNLAGAGPFSNVVTVKDETPFDSADMNIGSQDVSADNSAGTSDLTVTFDFYIYSGRYADVSHTPIVKLFNGATEITPITTTFTWDTHQTATITLTVPAGSDYSPYQLRVYDVDDSSQNSMDPADYESQSLY